MFSAPRYQPHDTVDDDRHWEGRWAPWDVVADPEARTVLALSLSSAGRYAGEAVGTSAPAIPLRLCRDCQITLDPARPFR